MSLHAFSFTESSQFISNRYLKEFFVKLCIILIGLSQFMHILVGPYAFTNLLAAPKLSFALLTICNSRLKRL